MRAGIRLGVDVGSVRVGLAASDPGGILATPVETIERDLQAGADQGRIAAVVLERQVLEVVVELIIPTTDTPGAREARVARFIDRAMGNFYDPVQVMTMRDGLDRMQADAQAAYGAAFISLGAGRQTELLTRYDAEAARLPLTHFFALIRQATTVGFFTSETGATKTLRYDPFPGEYRGCVPLKEIGRAWAT